MTTETLKIKSQKEFEEAVSRFVGVCRPFLEDSRKRMATAKEELRFLREKLTVRK